MQKQKMKMPDVTPAQMYALAVLVVGQLVAFGWVQNSREQLVVSILVGVFATVLKLADAVIRHGRAQIGAAAILAAGEAGVTAGRGAAGTLSLHEHDAQHQGAEVVVREDTSTAPQRE